MRMKKLTALVLACACICAALSGCHGSAGLTAFETPDTFDESRPIEITFWAKNDTNKAQTAVYEQAIADFMTYYPNVTVNLRLYTDYSRIYSDVITNIPTNTTPNVCITYPDHIATYMTGTNSVVALDTLFADGKYGLGGSEVRFDSPQQSEIVPQFLEECVIDGVHYALPFMRSTEACYVNVTLLNEIGYELPEVLTWDFVWEVSEAAMALGQDAEGNYIANGQKTFIPFIYKSTDNMMIQMLRQKGADYSTAQGDILIFNDTTDGLLREIARHAATGAFSTFKISSYPANFLNAGQCIFAIDSTAGATWMGANAPLSDISEDKFVQFDTAVMSVPQFDPQNPQMISQGPSVCIFNKADPQEVLASWLFVQYLLSNDVQLGYAQTEGYVPVTTKAQESAEYQDYLARSGEDFDLHYDVKIEASELLLANTASTFVTPVFNGSASLRSAAGQMIENVTKSVRRNQVVDDEYIENLHADVISLYKLDQGGDTLAQEKAEFGPLPVSARALIGVLCCAWAGILAYVSIDAIKKKKAAK